MNVLSPEKNSTKRTFCLGIKLILRLFRQKAFLFLRSFDIRIILIRWYFCRKINLVLRLFELILILILCSFDLIIFLLLWSFDEKCFLLHKIFFFTTKICYWFSLPKIWSILLISVVRCEIIRSRQLSFSIPPYYSCWPFISSRRFLDILCWVKHGHELDSMSWQYDSMSVFYPWSALDRNPKFHF